MVTTFKKGAEFLSLVPAGGLGSRLGVITKDIAKPAIAMSFDHSGEIKRMIDYPLETIKQLGGIALVTLLHNARSLEFISEYECVLTTHEYGPGNPIDSARQNIDIIKNIDTEKLAIIPSDSMLSDIYLSNMLDLLSDGIDAVLLSSRHLSGHNIQYVDRNSMMINDETESKVGDLGIHVFTKEWFLDAIQAIPDEESIDIWDLYGVHDKSLNANVRIYTPNDVASVDIGTPDALYKMIMLLNQTSLDKYGSITFPGTTGNNNANSIHLPHSTTSLRDSNIIVPERRQAYSKTDVIIV